MLNYGKIFNIIFKDTSEEDFLNRSIENFINNNDHINTMYNNIENMHSNEMISMITELNHQYITLNNKLIMSLEDDHDSKMKELRNKRETLREESNKIFDNVEKLADTSNKYADKAGSQGNINDKKSGVGEKIKKFFKRLWEVIVAFIKKIWEIITYIPRKIIALLQKKKENNNNQESNNKDQERSKKGITYQELYERKQKEIEDLRKYNDENEKYNKERVEKQKKLIEEKYQKLMKQKEEEEKNKKEFRSKYSNSDSNTSSLVYNIKSISHDLDSANRILSLLIKQMNQTHEKIVNNEDPTHYANVEISLIINLEILKNLSQLINNALLNFYSSVSTQINSHGETKRVDNNNKFDIDISPYSKSGNEYNDKSISNLMNKIYKSGMGNTNIYGIDEGKHLAKMYEDIKTISKMILSNQNYDELSRGYVVMRDIKYGNDNNLSSLNQVKGLISKAYTYNFSNAKHIFKTIFNLEVSQFKN